MKLNKSTIIIILLLSIGIQKSLASNEDFIAQRTTIPFTIDGIANESVWDTAVWYPMSWVWIPYNASMDNADFTGRFKLSWDTDRLYLFVEVIDDSLSDKYTIPIDNYWNDDCVEVFLDENKSGGPHENSFNAFAYHVSSLFDVVDFGLAGADTFNSHINAKWLKQDSLYTWELAINIFDDSYQVGATNIPVELEPDKVMGFSLAYCDNDGGSQRDNFIGSRYQTAANANRSYQDASIFGSLKLVDSTYIAPSTVNMNNNIASFSLYPNPANDHIYYTLDQKGVYKIRLVNLTGQIIYENQSNKDSLSGSISVSAINSGVYLLEFIADNKSYTRQVLIY